MTNTIDLPFPYDILEARINRPYNRDSHDLYIIAHTYEDRTTHILTWRGQLTVPEWKTPTPYEILNPGDGMQLDGMTRWADKIVPEEWADKLLDKLLPNIEVKRLWREDQ